MADLIPTPAPAGSAPAAFIPDPVAIADADGTDVVWQNPNVSTPYRAIYEELHPLLIEDGWRSILNKKHARFPKAVKLLKDTFRLPFEINTNFDIVLELQKDEPARPEDYKRMQEDPKKWDRPNYFDRHDDNVYFTGPLNDMAVQGTIIGDFMNLTAATPVHIRGAKGLCADLYGNGVVARAWQVNRCDHYDVYHHYHTRHRSVVWFHRHRSPKEIRNFINKNSTRVRVRKTAALKRVEKIRTDATVWEDGIDGTMALASMSKPPESCISWILPSKSSERWLDVIDGMVQDKTVYARAFVDAS